MFLLVYVFFDFAGLFDGSRSGSAGSAEYRRPQNFQAPFRRSRSPISGPAGTCRSGAFVSRNIYTPLQFHLVRRLGIGYAHRANLATLLIAFAFVGLWHRHEPRLPGMGHRPWGRSCSSRSSFAIGTRSTASLQTRYGIACAARHRSRSTCSSSFLSRCASSCGSSSAYEIDSYSGYRACRLWIAVKLLARDGDDRSNRRRSSSTRASESLDDRRRCSPTLTIVTRSIFERSRRTSPSTPGMRQDLAALPRRLCADTWRMQSIDDRQLADAYLTMVNQMTEREARFRANRQVSGRDCRKAPSKRCTRTRES